MQGFVFHWPTFVFPPKVEGNGREDKGIHVIIFCHFLSPLQTKHLEEKVLSCPFLSLSSPSVLPNMVSNILIWILG